MAEKQSLSLQNSVSFGFWGYSRQTHRTHFPVFLSFYCQSKTVFLVTNDNATNIILTAIDFCTFIHMPVRTIFPYLVDVIQQQLRLAEIHFGNSFTRCLIKGKVRKYFASFKS